MIVDGLIMLLVLACLAFLLRFAWFLAYRRAEMKYAEPKDEEKP